MAFQFKTITSSKYWLIIIGFLSLLTVPTQSGERVPSPVIEVPTNVEACIRPTEFMRRNHMHLLTHKRDKTMRQGIRTKDSSLTACIDCHANKKTDGSFIPVNAKGQFCSSCHEYTAVKLDCFECHRTTPETGLETTRIPVSSHSKVATGAHELNNLKNYLNEAR